MKYKHLDTTWFFSFMCLKETEKMNEIYLGIVGRGRQCVSTNELENRFCFDKEVAMLCVLYQILGYLINCFGHTTYIKYNL